MTLLKSVPNTASTWTTKSIVEANDAFLPSVMLGVANE